jgi:DNA-directed RNA polymerase subunit H (RpoH/RPB5)
MNIILQNFKSRETLLELLKKRGFQTEDYEGFSKNEIDTMTKNNTLDFLLTTKPSDNAVDIVRKVYVKYLSMQQSISPTLINNMVEDLYENADEKYILSGNDILVIVVPEEPNDKIENYLVHLFETRGFFITIFNIRRLQFNVLKHELQPREVEILSASHVEELKKNLNIRNIKSELPEISRFDPLAMAVFLRPNEVCKLTRDSPTAISSIYYRICV